MKGSITHYVAGNDQPHVLMSGSTGFLILDEYAYAPTLLIEPGDQEYLRRLAKAATELADRVDQTGATS